MYKIVVHLSEEHLDSVKEALFSAGAGRYKQYDRCSWQTLGQGQYRPLTGSSPYQGKVGQMEIIEEYRVEMICDKEHIIQAVQALLKTHPYEEPAYEIYRFYTLNDLEKTAEP